jgi:hypothetical protein
MSNDYNDNSSLEIMSYLIKKLESNYSSLLKFNNLLDSLDSPDSFFSLRKDLKLLFKDLIDNFNQGIFAIKALTNQNKKILEEMKLKDFENKEIIDQLNKINTENKKLKTQVIKIKEENVVENLENFEENKKEEIRKEKNSDKRKEEKLNNNNKYEFAELSNVRDIMDNMKKKKMKLKMAFEHYKNQEQNNNIDNDDNDY